MEIGLRRVPPEAIEVRLTAEPEQGGRLEVVLPRTDETMMHVVESAPVGLLDVRATASSGLSDLAMAFAQVEVMAGRMAQVELTFTATTPGEPPGDPPVRVDSADLIATLSNVGGEDITQETLVAQGSFDAEALMTYTARATETLGGAPSYVVTGARVELGAGEVVDVDRLEDLWRGRFELSLVRSETQDVRLIGIGDAKNDESVVNAVVQNADLSVFGPSLAQGLLEARIEGEAKRSSDDDFRASVRVVINLRAE